MKREIREKRLKLKQSAMRLRELSSLNEEVSYERSLQMREEQENTYKKWKFYDKMIKANDKVKSSLK